MTDSDAFGARSVGGRARALLHREGGPARARPGRAPAPPGAGPRATPGAGPRATPGPARHPDEVADQLPGTDPNRRTAPAVTPSGGRPSPAPTVSGMVLATRYRLTTQRAPVLGAQMWRAVDEVLGRDVGILVVPGSDRRAPELLSAARRAATVADQHFLRVYDAGTCLTDPTSPLVYVVQEWVTARSLASLLADGPLEPERSALVAREVAEAVATAHQQGLTHRSVTPDRVLVSANGAVRVVGLEVAAALAELPPGATAEGRRVDVRAVGAVLYAGLTGRWPLDLRPPGTTGPSQPAADTPGGQLRAAPRRHGRVFGPRQVRPGIPRSHDLLALRALGHDAGDAGGPVTSARELAGLLGEVTESAVDANTPLPQLRELAAAPHPGPPPGTVGTARGRGVRPRTGAPSRLHRAGSGGASTPGDLLTSPGGSAGTETRPARTTGVTATAVAVLALVAVGLGLLVWQVSAELGRATGGGVLRDAHVPAPGPAAAAPSLVTAAVVDAPVAVAGVRDFDPQGSDGRENPATAGLAVDGDPVTAWRTSRYDTARLGGLKDGVGLLVDLGSVRQVAGVDVGLVGTGTAVELRTAGIASAAPTSLDGFGVVATDAHAGADVSLRPATPVLARYLLLWLKELPRDGTSYRGGIRTLDVRG